jgi:hypothetical protein
MILECNRLIISLDTGIWSSWCKFSPEDEIMMTLKDDPKEFPEFAGGML